MLMDEPVEDLRGFHECYMEGKVELYPYLKQRGLGIYPCLPGDYDFRSNSAYLVMAASLNQRAKMHMVIMNFSWMSQYEVIDPLMGVAGRDYYIHNGCELVKRNQARLYSFVPQYRVWLP